MLNQQTFTLHSIYRKSFWHAYSQLGMLGTIFAKVPAVALTATVTEQTKYINFPWNGGSRNHCSRRTPIGRTCSTHVQHNHTLVMTKSKCCFFCTQQNYKLWERWCLLQWFIPIYTPPLWTLYIDNIIGTIDLKTVSLGWGSS